MGDVAVYVSARGELWAEVAVCDGYVDGLSVWSPSAEDRGAGSDSVLDLELEQRVSRPEPVLLGALDGVARLPLSTSETYAVTAASSNNRWTAGSTEFTLDELRDLEPDQVLAKGAGGGKNRVVDASPAQWAQRVCEEYVDGRR